MTTTLLVLALAAACAPVAPPPDRTALLAVAPPASETATPRATSLPVLAEIDRRFIDMMVPHHEGALAMAQIAQQRAARPELQHLAAEILRAQAAEIDRMRGWRDEWYGSPETPPMSRMPMVMADTAPMGEGGHTMDMQADVERLRATPDPFDAAFIDAMVAHHQSAIDAARVALRETARAEIRELALDIIDARLREIGQLRAWRLAWFGGAPGTPVSVAGPAPTKEVRDVPDEHAGH